MANEDIREHAQNDPDIRSWFGSSVIGLCDEVESLEKQVPRWRSIADDGVPTEDAPYIVYAPSADPDKPLKWVAWYDPAVGWSLIAEHWIPAITHWMPMPESPSPKVDNG